MAITSTSQTIETPCINVCQLTDVDLNNPNTHCKGCYRTVSEIASWGRMTAEQRRAIMNELPARRQQS